MTAPRTHEKGKALAAYMAHVGAKKQRGKRTDRAKSGTSANVAEVARQLGVPERTARFHLTSAEDYEAAAPEQRARVDARTDFRDRRQPPAVLRLAPRESRRRSHFPHPPARAGDQHHTRTT